MNLDQNTNIAGMLHGGSNGEEAVRCIVAMEQGKLGVSTSIDVELETTNDIPAREYRETGKIGKRDSSLPFSTSVVQSQPQFPSFKVLGVRVDAIQMSDAVERLRSWMDSPQTVTRYVAVTGMHGIAESRENSQFHSVLNAADLVVPDGMPLVWLGRMQGFPLRHRVCGSELMDTFCQVTGSAYRHFFFGGAPGVARQLAQALHEKHGIVVAGTYVPPFRALTDAEEEDLAAIVDKASPDVFWVGLSTPKQEKWMYEHRHKFRVPVMLGVGAAFDMNSGKLQRAPEWMRENGLEWLYRLGSEPRRLWKRYLITIPKAVWFVCLELFRFRQGVRT